MVGKEVRLFLKNGLRETVICWDFKVGIENGVSALKFRTSVKEMYVIELEKVDRYEVRFVWLFNDFLPPNTFT